MNASESEVVHATVRDGVDDLHIECRFADGQKFAAVTVDYSFPQLAHRICELIVRPKEAGTVSVGNLLAEQVAELAKRPSVQMGLPDNSYGCSDWDPERHLRPKEAGKVVAWLSEDGRTISEKQKSGALSDGGASAFSVAPFSIPAYSHPAPSVPAEVMAAVERLSDQFKFSSHPNGRDTGIVLAFLQSLNAG